MEAAAQALLTGSTTHCKRGDSVLGIRNELLYKVKIYKN